MTSNDTLNFNKLDYSSNYPVFLAILAFGIQGVGIAAADVRVPIPVDRRITEAHLVSATNTCLASLTHSVYLEIFKQEPESSDLYTFGSSRIFHQSSTFFMISGKYFYGTQKVCAEAGRRNCGVTISTDDMAWGRVNIYVNREASSSVPESARNFVLTNSLTTSPTNAEDSADFPIIFYSTRQFDPVYDDWGNLIDPGMTGAVGIQLISAKATNANGRLFNSATQKEVSMKLNTLLYQNCLISSVQQSSN